jgi:hypothetical protein
MIIANPLYDVVFKYLMEDIEIAREILSTILNENILYLEVKPQETVTEMTADGVLRVLRFDFKATIETVTGDIKKVLIELQKMKVPTHVMRFRRYLGENYKTSDEIIVEDGTIIKTPLPIVTIYILGFNLTKLTNPVVKISRDYQDILTGKSIDVKDEFVELLTHDSYIIQVRGLPPETKTKLLRVLQVFNPKFKTKDSHKLDFTGTTDEPILEKMIRRLERAIADDEMRRIMDVEDEIESGFAILSAERDKAKQEAEVERQKAEVERQKAEVERQKAEVERQKAEVERQKAEAKEHELDIERQKTELLMQQIAELQQQIKK